MLVLVLVLVQAQMRLEFELELAFARGYTSIHRRRGDVERLREEWPSSQEAEAEAEERQTMNIGDNKAHARMSFV